MKKRRDYWVTVCSSCLRACCWHGIFYCDEYQSAGTTKRKASELRKLKKENYSYFSIKNLVDTCGDVEYVEEAEKP